MGMLLQYFGSFEVYRIFEMPFASLLSSSVTNFMYGLRSSQSNVTIGQQNFVSSDFFA